MNTLGFLFFFMLAGALGFVIGQLYQHKGRSLLDDVTSRLPSDMQSTVRATLLALGAMLGLFFLAVLADEGPEAFIPFFFISLWLLTTTWVYLDARERGGRAKAWALLTFFTFVFGLCGYLITRPDKPRACPRCAFKLREEFVVCPYCGPQAGLSCSHCQATLDSTWRYCPYCQTRVIEDAPEDTPSGPASTLKEEPISPATPDTYPFAPA